MRIFTLSLLAVSLLTLAACGDSDSSSDEAAGPNLDGSWLVQSITCDGGEIPIGEFTLVVDGDSGQFIQAFGPECVINLEEDYSYPTDSSFAITPTAISCEPSTGCAAIFGGADCLPLSPPVTFDFERDGDSLTFTKTAAPGDACPEGAAQVVLLEKQ
jgi:hypothetical protein